MEPGKPEFTYLKKTTENTSIKGLFAFTLYIKREHLENNKGSIIFERALLDTPYVKGIQLYIDMIRKKDSVFKDWKVLIYTDAPTLELFTEENVFINDPYIDICVVQWDYYTRIEGGHMNGDILRCMRFCAFFDFPTIPVFVRDADTIFITDAKTKAGKFIKYFKEDSTKDIYDWEKNFYEGAQSHPNTWILGTSIGYKREWHKNTKKGYLAPLGAFAGLQSVIPSVPCFQSKSLWNKAIQFIIEESKRIETKQESIKKDGMEIYVPPLVSYDNNWKNEKVGKDERILIYIFFPECDLNNIFFFELDYMKKRNYALKGHVVRQPEYPTFIFQRGSNVNIRSLFEKAIEKRNTPFLVNLEENRKGILKRNLEEEKEKKQTLKNRISTLKNKNLQFDEKFDISTIIISIYYAIKGFDYDLKLADYFNQYREANEQAVYMKYNFEKKMSYINSNAKMKTEQAKLQDSIYAKNKAMDEFLQKALSMKSKEEIVQYVSGWERPKIKSFLDIYTATSKEGGKRTRRKRKYKV